ncbi:hypothetical protein [Paraburkholderia sp. J12]|uniref:hypothetical protein n=1 Tax=Paraburkholderia sp. J12 TaxID=2805432 RepID=UPI002ABE9CE2|nr:hypothetical protein [Paraburkholderia sp. J12]
MSYSIDSTVRDLLESDSAKAVVEKHLPGIASHPLIGMALGMSLATAAKFSDGLVSQEVLEKVDTDLRALG